MPRPSDNNWIPAGVALDGAGYLYIGDSANNTIRTTRVVPIRLQVSVVVNQLVLSWPMYPAGYLLETASALTPGALWTPLTNGITPVGNNLVLTKELTGPVAYYRLHKP